MVASFDYRSIKSREWDQTSATVSTGVTGTVKAYQKTDTMVLGFGFRPSIKALGGTWYAGMGFAYVLPFDSITTQEISNPSAAAFAVTKVETTSSKNAGIGAYGEFGYQFSITDNLYIGLGARALVATANNDGKSDVKKTTGTASGAAVADVTTNYAATVDSTATPVKTKYSSTGITDVSATVSVGFRF